MKLWSTVKRWLQRLFGIRVKQLKLNSVAIAAMTLEKLQHDLPVAAGFPIAVVKRMGMTVFNMYSTEGTPTLKHVFYLQSPDQRRLGVEITLGDATTVEATEEIVRRAVLFGLRAFTLQSAVSEFPPILRPE